jgi:hypothetical protein
MSDGVTTLVPRPRGSCWSSSCGTGCGSATGLGTMAGMAGAVMGIAGSIGGTLAPMEQAKELFE